MKTVTVSVKEISYGFVEVEVQDNATDEEITEKANELYENGCVTWMNSDFKVTDIK